MLLRLILAAPTGAVENHAIREFLADRRRDMLSTIRDRLERGIADGDLTATPTSLDAIAPLLHHRGLRTLPASPRRRQPRQTASGHHLRDGRLGHAHLHADPPDELNRATATSWCLDGTEVTRPPSRFRGSHEERGSAPSMLPTVG